MNGLRKRKKLRVVQYSDKFMHGVVFTSHNNTVQKHNNKE